MTTPFSHEEWEDKLRRLAGHDPDLDRYVVRVRHWRKGATQGPDGPVGGVQRVAVFHSEAKRGERPHAVFDVPVGVDLSGIEDGGLLEVEGWPEPGGAIAFDAGDDRVLSIGPGELPLFRVPRFGRPL